jgi:DNA-binding XRE family transcriptional regulator
MPPTLVPGTQVSTNQGDNMVNEIMRKRKMVAQRLCDARIKQNKSQGEVARKAGIDRKTVNRIENNHFSPTLDTLFRLCKVLNIKPITLFTAIK